MNSFIKRIFIILVLLIFVTAFSSSYVSLRIDNLAFVVALGIDVADNNNLKVSSCIDTICNNFENSIEKIMNIQYYYDLNKIFSVTNELTEKEWYSLYENLINEYLVKIKNLHINLRYSFRKNIVYNFLFMMIIYINIKAT